MLVLSLQAWFCQTSFWMLTIEFLTPLFQRQSVLYSTCNVGQFSGLNPLCIISIQRFNYNQYNIYCANAFVSLMIINFDTIFVAFPMSVGSPQPYSSHIHHIPNAQCSSVFPWGREVAVHHCGQVQHTHREVSVTTCNPESKFTNHCLSAIQSKQLAPLAYL